MENLGEKKSFEIKTKLKEDPEFLLIDEKLFEYVKTNGEVKIVLVKDGDTVKLVSCKRAFFHAIVVLAYMVANDIEEISILGGGRINYVEGNFLIGDRSGSFGRMYLESFKMISDDIKRQIQLHEASMLRDKDVIPETFSYNRILHEVHVLLSD